jgi:hypothetical protein
MSDSDWSDYDDEDLWADPVRKWMMDWHTPVKRMFRQPCTFRGGAMQILTGGPSNGYVLEDGTTFYVAEDGTTFYVQES